MKYCSEQAASILNSGRSIRWGETGPALLRTALKTFGDTDWVLPWQTYCPVHHWLWRDLIEPEALHRLQALQQDPEVLCVHLWNELWRRNGVEKFQVFGQDTFVGYLLDQYKVEAAAE